MFSFLNSPDLVNTQEISLEQIQRISIGYISENITVRETEGTALILKEYFTVSDPDIFAQITREGSDLTIRHGERPILFNALRGYVEIYLPRDYYGLLNLKSVSGRITVENRLVLDALSVASTSGRITMGRVMAGTAVLSSVSGSVHVQDLQAEADVHTTSGSIHIAAASGDGEYKSVSGSIDLSYQAVTGDISANSTSGRVRLVVPRLLSFEVEANSISGSVHIPMDGTVAGGRHAVSGTIGASPQVRIHLRTVSGRIEVVPSP